MCNGPKSVHILTWPLLLFHNITSCNLKAPSLPLSHPLNLITIVEKSCKHKVKATVQVMMGYLFGSTL